ncbi:MAG: GNAT family N-acetyltransferase [Cyanobacteria bacterium J06639_1]
MTNDCDRQVPAKSDRTLFIRSALASEFSTVLDLQAESLRGIGGGCYTTAQVESLVKGQGLQRERRDEVLLVAEREDGIVGFVAIDPVHPRLSGLYVRPACARQGIGTALLQGAEHRVRKRRSRVMVVLSSMVAVEFYRSRGYRYISKTGFYSSNRVWVPCVRFRKPLVTLGAFEQWWEDWMAPSLGNIW